VTPGMLGEQVVGQAGSLLESPSWPDCRVRLVDCRLDVPTFDEVYSKSFCRPLSSEMAQMEMMASTRFRGVSSANF
jgi:hypothetical protein